MCDQSKSSVMTDDMFFVYMSFFFTILIYNSLVIIKTIFDNSYSFFWTRLQMALKTTIACQRIMTKSCLASESTRRFLARPNLQQQKKKEWQWPWKKTSVCVTWILYHVLSNVLFKKSSFKSSDRPDFFTIFVYIIATSFWV